MRRIILSLLLLSAVGAMATAEPYVSYNGGFQIDIPADWSRIDYRTVDYFLSQSGAGKSVMSYDAVFAPTSSNPFFSKQYFILTVDTSGPMDDHSVDSALYVLSSSFGKNVKYFPVGNFMSDIQTNTPVYDRDRRVVSILSDITEQGEPLKMHLLMMKYYERGTAYFYCYAPDSIFEASKKTFIAIIESFGKPSKGAGTPKEELKIADLTKEAPPTETPIVEEDGLKKYIPFIPIPVIIVILIAIARRRRRREQQTKEKP
jgi:hypothetical protein